MTEIAKVAASQDPERAKRIADDVRNRNAPSADLIQIAEELGMRAATPQDVVVAPTCGLSGQQVPAS
jgi:hypothetical protein